MLKSSTIEIIKTTIGTFLPGTKVVLFGSMARGDFNIDSDFDIMVITPDTYEEKDKITWRAKVRKALIRALHAPVDLLINSEEEINRKRKLPGHIVQYAMEEGVVL